MTRLGLSILRQATEPITAWDIAFQMLSERTLNRDDQKLLRVMRSRIACALRLQRDKNGVRSEPGPGNTCYGH